MGGLSLLTIINQWLGFFSVRNQARGRIYSIVGFIANFYLLYVGVRLVINHQLWGWLILLAFLILFYFSILNIIYYFTDKVMKWDISPFVDKILGGGKEEEEALKTVPANGLYSRDQVLDTSIFADYEQRQNLDYLFQQMKEAKLVSSNYGQMSHFKIKDYLAEHSSIEANYPGTLLPYFDMKYAPNGLVIYGGINEISARPIGLITKVGLSDAILAVREYHLSLASVVLHGGEGLVVDQATGKAVKRNLPIHLTAEVAYQKRINNNI